MQENDITISAASIASTCNCQFEWTNCYILCL